MFPSNLEQAIFRTLAYFAYFRFPLTYRELHTWLLAPKEKYTYAQVRECLETSVWLRERTTRWGGYVSKEACEQWGEERRYRYIDAQRKWRKAYKVAHVLALFSGVVGIAVGNSLAWHATHEKGDIDFFILTKPGQVWSVRLFTTTLLRLFRMRPGEAKKDSVCLSFFADTEVWNFDALREGKDDWYLAYWVASLRWIEGEEGIHEKSLQHNAWVHEVLPNACSAQSVASIWVKNRIKIPLRFPEQWARMLQERIFSGRIQEKRNKGTHVVINEHMLKFHEEDTRAAICAFVRNACEREGI